MKIVNNKPVSQSIPIDNVRKGGYLKLKDLREFVAKAQALDENTPVLVDRIEDSYFLSDGNNGWRTIKVFWTSNSYQKPKYSYKNISEMYKSTEGNQIDESLIKITEDEQCINVNQYSDGIPAHSIHVSYDKATNDPVVFITPHY